MGILSLTRMIVDILPAIDIPVVMVVWNYPGLSPEDMERRVVIISERAYSTTVNGIERIESQSIAGIGLLKIYFQPGTDLGTAIAQISGSIKYDTPYYTTWDATAGHHSVQRIQRSSGSAHSVEQDPA